MARQSGNSLFRSLRGKIWISTSVLAFFICTFGLISYLVVSLLVNDAFYGVFTPFLLLAFMVMLFGWWLSNEVVNPVEKVILLAKSLERSTSTSIPRTSGSTETDQLLHTIQRNNQQMQKIVTSMDKVANGNLDIAPIQGSDRLSTSFQKLLAKVSESIHAKEELEELKKAVSDLKMDVSGVRGGNLDATIRNEYPQTREISDAFKYLIENLSKLITAVRDGAEGAEAAVNRVDEDMQTLIQRDEVRVQDMTQASIALKQVPNLISKITEDLVGSAKSARQSIEKARHGNKVANQNSTSVSNLRKQIREDVKRIQNLNERSHDIEKVAKTVEDLASRTNMIALNASIQATEMGEGGHGFVLVAEEVERLAARANGTNKQISTLNKSILAEIAKVENSVEATMTEVASLSKFAIETGNVLGEMERYISQFLNLQENLIAYSRDQSEETDNAFRTFAGSISETESTIVSMRDSSAELLTVARLVRELNLSVGEFRLAEEMPFFGKKEPEDIEPDAFESEAEENDLYDEFANQEFDSKVFDSSQKDAAEYESKNDAEEEFKQDQTPAYESYESDEIVAVDSIEHAVEESPAQSFDFLELENADNPDSKKDDEGGQEFVASDSNGVEEEEYLMDYNVTAETEPVMLNEPNDSQIFDLYDASFNADSKPDVFDSGEFASDELIEESGPEDQNNARKFNSSDTNIIDADEIDQLLEAAVFKGEAKDNNHAVDSQ